MQADDGQCGWSLPPRQGLYDPRFEHDACGIGFVAHVEGRRSHKVLDMALEALCNHAHRGAVADDRKTGDGAGILTQLPHEFFARELRRMGIEPPPPGDLAVGQLFLNKANGEDRARARDLIRQILSEMKIEVLAFRSVPVIESALGQRALHSRPWLGQVILRRTDEACEAGDAFERLLYLARKQIVNAARVTGVQRLYIASMSSRTIVYKGLVMAAELVHFYPDLSDPDYKTAIAVFHQRYSTNTFPTWERAQPFRLLCHNGEINTLQGNENWMRAREADMSSPYWPEPDKQLRPIIAKDSSDSGKLDNALELLVRSGRDIRHAVMMMIPEAWERLPEGEVTPERRAFYEYHSALMEPWDGPAAVTYTDGRIVGTAMDRNGLRPARYVVLDNGLVISASEAGSVGYDESRVIRKGRIGPGQIFCVDTTRGVIMDDEEITQKFAARKPYDRWIKENLVYLDSLLKKPEEQGETEAGSATNGHFGSNGAHVTNGAGQAAHAVLGTPLSNRQASFGYTSEEMIVVLRPMLTTGQEPVGAMGDDTPPAAMSKMPRPLFHYFKQRFAEVTNPPIDPLREELVMSTRVLLGKRGNLLDESPEAVRLLALKSPVLLPHQMAALRTLSHPEFRTVTVDALWQAPASGDLTPDAAGAALAAAVEKLCRDAEDAVRSGARVLVISDEQADIHTLPIPSLLAIGAVHHHLIRQGLRMRASLVSASGEPREVHHFACLIGYGANAVYPYLAYETVADIVHEGRKTGSLTVDQALKNFVKAADKGLLKVMSKMGISTLDAYCGAQIFEALGIGQELLDVAFVDTPSVLGGVGFATVAEDVLAWHQYGYPESDTSHAIKLVTWGLYKTRRGGELHEWSPQIVHALTQIARPKKTEDIPANYRKYADMVNSINVAPRHLLSFRRTRPSIPATQVELVERILRRFSTAAMSHGALGAEAHETLAIAMNRLGGMSNSGEGGEDKDRYFTERASKIKQVASGRFGVTPEYLMSAEELQIKMAQGSKPGEGGQLPGHKVTAEIAVLRHSTPGVALISPPPHHDIYSIEDLAQLIWDLKAINPNAKVSVKLVSEMGVGTIAAGVAKGMADVIHISGASGGTGASPLSSVKNAGLPWEIGLAETHQVLLANGLRTRVTVRTDGGLATGRDVVIAAMLGADEMSFGTSAMIAEGCIMARVCHKNTCPVGVATQDPELRKKFTGTPEQVMNFMTAIAEDVREILADLGFRSLDEVVGHPEYLEQVIHGREAGFMDLSPLLYVPDTGTARRNVFPRNELVPPDETLSDRITEQVLAGLQANPDAPIRLVHKIRNTDRTVGAQVSGQLALRYGDAGLPEGQIRIDFEGTAGQSFGAFAIRGLSLYLKGAANDYVGKGLGGGEIVISPSEDARFVPHQNVILGNTALYGATAGKLFAAGVAGERFAVRNSGAIAVIEGAGEHCCEYMTGGCVVILGETGRNVAAGMTGGQAFIYDVNDNFERRYNKELVNISRLRGDGYEQYLKSLIVEHYEKSGSQLAHALLENWETQRQFFWHLMPRDNVVQIESATEGSVESEDEEETAKA
ncbi:MAG: glutamate synthase large subunit [Caldilineaceae bacterium]|nr:glutamate synthase large subunit [Caldilineaceae bacterium]